MCVCVSRRRHHPPLTTQEPARRSITTDRRIGQTDRQKKTDVFVHLEKVLRKMSCLEFSLIFSRRDT